MKKTRRIAEDAADRIMHGVGTDCADCIEAAIADGTRDLRAEIARLTTELAERTQERDTARQIATEGRLAGRAEAAAILLRQEAESFTSDSNDLIESHEIGCSGEWGCSWIPEKVKALFNVPVDGSLILASELDRIEGLYWHARGELLELDGVRKERDGLAVAVDKARKTFGWIMNHVNLGHPDDFILLDVYRDLADPAAILAAHDAAVKARAKADALREAATQIESEWSETLVPDGMLRQAAMVAVHFVKVVADRLRELAAQAEAGDIRAKDAPQS